MPLFFRFYGWMAPDPNLKHYLQNLKYYLQNLKYYFQNLKPYLQKQ